jgi:hypothetical protein
MEASENEKSVVESLIERVEQYGKTSYELFMFKAIDKVSNTISTLASRMCAIIFLFLFIIILQVAIALWLGDLLGKGYYGFFCVAALDALIWAVLYFLIHKWFKKSISNSIVSQLFNNK